jgi:hypothetical protein
VLIKSAISIIPLALGTLALSDLTAGADSKVPHWAFQPIADAPVPAVKNRD